MYILSVQKDPIHMYMHLHIRNSQSFHITTCKFTKDLSLTEISYALAWYHEINMDLYMQHLKELNYALTPFSGVQYSTIFA